MPQGSRPIQSPLIFQENGMLDLAIKGIVVGDEQVLLEMGCRLHGNDGIRQLLAAVGIHAVGVGSSKMKKRRPPNSSIMARGKARASSVGSPGQHGETPIVRNDPDTVLLCLPLQVDRVRVDLVEYVFCTPSNAIAKMLGHRRCGICNYLAGEVGDLDGGLQPVVLPCSSLFVRTGNLGDIQLLLKAGIKKQQASDQYLDILKLLQEKGVIDFEG